MSQWLNSHLAVSKDSAAFPGSEQRAGLEAEHPKDKLLHVLYAGTQNGELACWSTALDL